jgi:signal transduction histidine kinase
MRATAGSGLATFLRLHRDAIIAAWAAAFDGHGPGAPAPSAHHLPDMIERLAAAIEAGDESTQPMRGLANRHAIARLHAGYGLREVISEFRCLRRAVTDVITQRGAVGGFDASGLAQMHDVIDRAIANAVDEYSAERDRAREHFISILSHDLAQPLNAITFGAKTLLAAFDADSSEHRTASLVASSAGRMHGMVGDLLEFARGRTGRSMPLTVAPVRVGALVCRVAEEVAAAHPARTIQCLVDDQDGAEAALWDGARVTQAISNVLTNAVTHGGDPIVVHAGERDERVWIEVRSQGAIAPEVLPHLCEPFAGGAQRRGLGLGLYIGDRIVAAHGGRVHARSQDDVTAVRLVLPRRAAAAPPA